MHVEVPARYLHALEIYHHLAFLVWDMPKELNDVLDENVE